MDSFYFYTGYANMTCWGDRVERVMQIRHIFAKYPEFNATLWEFESSLYDFSVVGKHVIYRSIIVAMICMAVISIFFIPSLCCILVATVSVGSISVGKCIQYFCLACMNLSTITHLQVPLVCSIGGTLIWTQLLYST